MTDEEKATIRFGELLRRAREAANLSQVDLAKRVPTTQAYVSRAERGLESPPLKMIVRFARAIGLRFRGISVGREGRLVVIRFDQQESADHTEPISDHEPMWDQNWMRSDDDP